jgi:hypothetical protein
MLCYDNNKETIFFGVSIRFLAKLFENELFQKIVVLIIVEIKMG